MIAGSIKKQITSLYLFAENTKYKFKSKKNKKGVLLVGLGKYNSNTILNAIKKSRHCYLVGVVTNDYNKGLEWSKKHNFSNRSIYNYSNFDSIKNNATIDIVYIALPDYLHSEFTIRAAKAGKDVICEKPLAMSYAEAKNMLMVCYSSNVMLGVGYRMYFQPHHLKIIEIANSKTYGKIKSITAGFGSKLPFNSSWRFNDKEEGYGVLGDLGIYLIQATSRLLNENPKFVTSTAEFVKDTNIPHTVSWQFEFNNKVETSLTVSYEQKLDEIFIEFEFGWIRLNPAFSYFVKGETHLGKLKIASNKNYITEQIDDFAKTVINNTIPLTHAKNALYDLKLIEHIKTAYQTGNKISCL
jgi:predicted dehydrogenase